MNISDEHAAKVCRGTGGAHMCSFLVTNPEGWECAKGTPVELVINARRAERSMKATGNNCSGPPYFAPSEEELKLNS